MIISSEIIIQEEMNIFKIIKNISPENFWFPLNNIENILHFVDLKIIGSTLVIGFEYSYHSEKQKKYIQLEFQEFDEYQQFDDPIFVNEDFSTFHYYKKQFNINYIFAKILTLENRYYFILFFDNDIIVIKSKYAPNILE